VLLDKKLTMTLSGTGVYFYLVRFFIEESTDSGIFYHYSIDTFASYRFRVLELLVYWNV
jgi:hypothetical protein